MSFINGGAGPGALMRRNYNVSPGVPLVSAPATDPFWANVSLLIYGNGPDGSSVITDEKGNAITANAARITTAQSKFDGSSLTMGADPNAGNNAQSTVAAAPGIWGFGSGDLTAELWLRSGAQVQNDSYILTCGLADIFSNGLVVKIASSKLFVKANGNPVLCNTPICDNVWRHIAVVRNGNFINCYVGGLLDGSAAFTGSLNATNEPFCIGWDNWYTSNDLVNSFVNSIRVTKGVARYTSNFTPPTAPFPNQ